MSRGPSNEGVEDAYAYFTTIADGQSDLFFSVASGWDIAIEANLGKVEVPDDLERFLTEQLFRNVIQVLPIYLSHALHV